MEAPFQSACLLEPTPFLVLQQHWELKRVRELHLEERRSQLLAGVVAAPNLTGHTVPQVPAVRHFALEGPFPLARPPLVWARVWPLPRARPRRVLTQPLQLQPSQLPGVLVPALPKPHRCA